MNSVYANTKVFHFSEKLADLKAGRISAPIHVRLKPTNRCNHRCSYCCYRNEALYLSERMNERDEIPREKLREIVEDLVAMDVQAVTFTGGGEPLCHPNIAEAIEGLSDGGVKVAMLTNGSLLSGDAADALGERATWVRISMDAANGADYARARGVSDNEFDKVCENIRSFAKSKRSGCVLGINYIVTSENAGQTFEFLSRMKQLGVDHVKVSGAVVSTQPDENAEYLRPFYDSVKEQIARGASELAGDAFGVIDKFHLPDSTQEGFERGYTRCPFAQCLTVIAADQNVYTCQDKAYTTSGLLGSIADCRFKDLWASDELRQKLLELNPSTDCRHHCVAHGKNLSLLDFLEADEEHLDFV